MGWELTGIPYTSMAVPGGIADAISVLRDAGLAARLGRRGVEDGGDLELEPPSGERGASGLLNEAALGRLVEATRDRVASAIDAGNRALLIGGDCPVLLGAVAAIGGGARPGLVMLDGHEDAWPPGRSETGEASDSELAIALGSVSVPLPTSLDRLVPLLRPSAVALLGPRDAAEIVAAGVRSLRDEVAYFADGGTLSSGDPDEVVGAALAAVDADRIWVHVDLDVLGADALAAVDYPQPGGLGWEELLRLAARAASDPRCRGVSVVIYNPDLDPDRSGAAAVVEFVDRLVERGGPAQPAQLEQSR